MNVTRGKSRKIKFINSVFVFVIIVVSFIIGVMHHRYQIPNPPSIFFSFISLTKSIAGTGFEK